MGQYARMPEGSSVDRITGSGRHVDDHDNQALDELRASMSRLEYLAMQLATGRHPRRDRGTDMATQLALMAAWRSEVRNGVRLGSIEEAELQFFSQNGEDGILLYLFSVIGWGRRTAVEVCAGDGVECNSANLIVNHGWHALLVDGDDENIRRADEFYRSAIQTWFDPPVTKCAWVTSETLDGILQDSGFMGEIDLLSLDVDGMDYWLWKSLTIADPRVVIVEFTPIFGADDPRVLAYDPSFVRPADIPFAGTSLAALNTLAKSRGFQLVGVERRGFNAFFVKSELAVDLPSPSVADCLASPAVHRTAERLAVALEPYSHALNWQTLSAPYDG
jgi:hypothetical protein